MVTHLVSLAHLLLIFHLTLDSRCLKCAPGTWNRKTKVSSNSKKTKVCTLLKVEQISFFRLKSRASLARYPTWRKATTKTVIFTKSHLFSLWEFSSSRKLFPFIIQRSIYPLRFRSFIHKLTSTHSNCIITGIITDILKQYSRRL